MAGFKSEFYGGSRLLTPLADSIGLPIDQINFLMCQLIAFGVAFPFRSYLSVEKVGTKTRHIVETVVGVFLTVYCFGYQIWHLVAQSLVSYAFMAYGGKRFSHALVFGWSMLYLSVCHIYRQVYDYGGYTLDITGPLMIQTQKLTSLAFALHDGRYKDATKLSADQKEHAVKKLPNILHYMSYMFYFHGIMVGPLTFYNDYIAFIDGSSLLKPTGSTTMVPKKNPTDDLNKVVIRKLLVASACCIGMMILPGLFFPPEKLNTPEYYNMVFMERMIFILGVMTLAKQKYYFAWKLADALNNAAGFGFSGYDSQGNPQWDLTDNVDIKGVELSTSLKVNIDSWNKKTLVWLRRVIYDRTNPKYATLAVFATSAFWHGFYPGYYLTFGGGAFMTIFARQVRRNVRPWFQTSSIKRLVYDVITFVATRFANAYLCFPFLVLEFFSCISMYSSLYFCLHILSIFGFIFFTLLPGAKQSSRPPRPATPAASTSDDAAANNDGAAVSNGKPIIEDSRQGDAKQDGDFATAREKAE